MFGPSARGSSETCPNKDAAPTPYQMPEKEDEAEGKRTNDGLYSQGTLDFVSGGIKIPSSKDKSEGGHYLLPS